MRIASRALINPLARLAVATWVLLGLLVPLVPNALALPTGAIALPPADGTYKLRVFFEDPTSQHILHLRELELFNLAGEPISARIVRTSMSSILSIPEGEEGHGFHGPATLIPTYYTSKAGAITSNVADGILSTDFPSTAISNNPWMQVELGQADAPCFLRLWNLEVEQYQLIGAQVQLTDPTGSILFHETITSGQMSYTFNLNPQAVGAAPAAQHFYANHLQTASA